MFTRNRKDFCMAMSFGSCFGARSRGPEMVCIACNVINWTSFFQRLFQILVGNTSYNSILVG